MQTPAERALVQNLARFLPALGNAPARLLAVGAGRSLSVEDQLTAAGRAFISDRLDVESCELDDPRVGDAWICSAESMGPVASDTYDAAFANFVLEHVPNVAAAAAELHRVLRPGGLFVASVPNPRALEFRVANATPLAFHEWVRGKEAWETHYDYGSVPRLRSIFENTGFETMDVQQYSFLEGYLHRVPIARTLARWWDIAATGTGADFLLGNVCVAFGKPA